MSAMRACGGALAALLLAACGGGTTSTAPGGAVLSFSASVRVGGLCCLIYSPQIAVDGNRVFVGWIEAIRYTTYTPLRRSNDGGASFPDALSFGDWTRGDQDQLRLATAPGLALHLAWEDTRGGTCDPFCRGARLFTTRSADGGETFAANQPLPTAGAGGEQGAPALGAAANGDLFAAWHEGNGAGTAIRFARRMAAGPDEAPVRVDAGQPAVPAQRFPALAHTTDGRVAVAWLDARSGKSEVYVARSLDRGGHFGIGARLHPEDALVTDRAGVRLAVTGAGRMIATWAEQRGGRWQVQVAVSLDGGQSFTTPRPIESSSAGDQTAPALAAQESGAVYLAWQDSRSGADRLRAARSRDGADSFEPSVLVDSPPSGAEGDQRQPALVVDAGGQLLAVWLDFSRPDPGIYFARSAR
ncbi:MAG: glycoside hydrolase [Vicinamibacteria bacterium]|nr:glycoside hydrolase [Vicinamibacteria bacterium]